MVFGAEASGGLVMSPYFIRARLKIERQMMLNYSGFCTAHGSKKVQKYLKEHVPLFYQTILGPPVHQI